MRIVVADDHPFYLDALERQLAKVFRGAEVRGVSSFTDLCSALGEAFADLVIVDFSLFGSHGDGPIREVVALAGNAPVIIISGVANTADIHDCVTAGVRGYLPKTMAPRLFTDAVSLILHGGTYLPIESALPRPDPVKPRTAEATAAGAAALDPRDRDLIKMIADGLSNKEIARCMDVQEATVKFYVSRLFRRLGVKNRSQAVAWAARADNAS